MTHLYLFVHEIASSAELYFSLGLLLQSQFRKNRISETQVVSKLSSLHTSEICWNVLQTKIRRLSDFQLKLVMCNVSESSSVRPWHRAACILLCLSHGCNYHQYSKSCCKIEPSPPSETTYGDLSCLPENMVILHRQQTYHPLLVWRLISVL